MLVTENIFRPSLMLTGKASVHPSDEPLTAPLLVRLNALHKKNIGLGWKDSSLLGNFVNYDSKKFYNIWLRQCTEKVSIIWSVTEAASVQMFLCHMPLTQSHMLT